MKGLAHQLELLRRRREAADAAGEVPSVAERPVPEAEVMRFGVAKIVSNTGAGAYTLTEQWWNPSGAGQWSDATKPLGYVQAAARDYRNRDWGQADACVLFWEQRAAGGGLEVLIDLTGSPEGVAQITGIGKVLDKWIDITQGTTKAYIDDAGDDWRGRTLWYSVRPYTGVGSEAGTPANADEDEWDDDGQDTDTVRCVVVGYDWDSDADEGGDVNLWTTGQTQLVLERDTGRLYILCCFDVRRQLRVTVRATAVKKSTDAGVPDITI